MIKQVLLVAALCVSFSTAAFAGPSTGYDSSEFVEDSFEAAINGAEVVFPYQENKIYKIYAQKGYITDIKMQSGESIISVTAGDTTRWIIDKAKVGKGRSVIEHLYIKPQYTCHNDQYVHQYQPEKLSVIGSSRELLQSYSLLEYRKDNQVAVLGGNGS